MSVGYQQIPCVRRDYFKDARLRGHDKIKKRTVFSMPKGTLPPNYPVAY